MTLFARRQFLAACGALPLAAQQPSPSPSWTQVFAHDEDDRQLVILELAFYSHRAAMAIALLQERGNVKSASLRTTDAGRSWTLGELKPAALSLQFLDEANGWMAAGNGIYKSTDAGQNWRRVLRNSNIRQVRFADPQRGYAAGAGSTVLETTDGGKTWKPLAAAAEIKTNKERTSFGWIEILSPNLGFILGGYSPLPPARRRNDLPAWMDPSAATLRRQTPSLSLVLQTIDGGRVWKPMSSSIFGRITRLSLGAQTGPNPGAHIGLSLVEFEDAFDYASEVYSLSLTTGKTERIYREAERAITDVLVLSDGSFLLAGVESPGRLRTAPIPGKVHILRGGASGKWNEMDVDYRATARRVRLAQSPAGDLFACTDSGMILHFK